MPELSNVLKTVRSRIRRYENQQLNEADTKSTLIQPVLRSLGWDVEDLEDVQREFKIRKADNPVDYALMLLRSPKLFVEAKSLGKDLDDRRWASQIMGYATVAGVEWVVLTDGNEYRLYNAHAPVPVEEKLFRKIRVSENASVAGDTLTLLSKAKIRENEISTLWKSHFVDRQVKTAIEELFWSDGVPDPALVRWIRKRVDTLGSNDIKASLTRLRIALDFPIEPSDGVESRTQTNRDSGTNNHADGGNASLAELIERGLLPAPLQLEKTYKGQRFVAQLHRDGTIEFGGKRYESPSSAAIAARATILGYEAATNGWNWWRYQDSDGKESTLAAARKLFVDGRS